MAIELSLKEPLKEYSAVKFLRICLKNSYTTCLYCNHARRIAVNGQSLAEHMIEQHRFKAKIDNITTEDINPKTIIEQLQHYLPELSDHYLNYDSYHSVNGVLQEPFPEKCDDSERIKECCKCRYVANRRKDLYLHNRKMHFRLAILCLMCRAKFHTFTDILCHICKGSPQKLDILDMKFRCCLCNVQELPSSFRLMVHLRKVHYSCDVCLEYCFDQNRLSSHVWKHKLKHLCYRCNLGYNSKMDITKHLFWKHGTESIKCKRCLQKRWRYVYHFCLPAASFTCDTCNMSFTKAKYLRVHTRLHENNFPYICTIENCEEKFISKRLLDKHELIHNPINKDIITEEISKEIEKDEKINEENSVKEHFIQNTSLKDENDKSIVIENDKKYEKEKEENKEDNDDDDGDGDDEDGNKTFKKNKRKKDSVSIFDLKAPNLSESSDNSDDDDNEDNDDKNISSKNNLSKLQEIIDDKKETILENKEENENYNENVMKIWQNLLDNKEINKENEEEEEGKWERIHVAYSDHDYCKIIHPKENFVNNYTQHKQHDYQEQLEKRDLEDKSHQIRMQENEKDIKNNSYNDNNSNASNSDKDSSCSCGSNCSCSTSSSEDDSSSSSSSSSDSDSDESSMDIREKSKSVSPTKRLNNVSPTIEVEALNTTIEIKEPQLLESDLETNESETDEDFYDKQPLTINDNTQSNQYMMLAKDDNDIIENGHEKFKKKFKKRKHERKQSINKINNNIAYNNLQNINIFTPYGINTDYSEKEKEKQHMNHNNVQIFSNDGGDVHIGGFGISVYDNGGGSSSEADTSLKRSKRMRRPNKFYGYTSDDEHEGQPPLMIGTRAFKPQPPPLLTWHKDDLPTPSKSILNNKHKTKSDIRKRRRSNTSKKRLFPKNQNDNSLPPIPRLKIKPSALGIKLPDVVEDPHNASLNEIDVEEVIETQNLTSSSSSDEENIVINESIEVTTCNSINVTTTPKEEITISNEIHETPVPQTKAFNHNIPPALLPNPDFKTLQYFKANRIRYPIRPPDGARKAREGESVYCYCRCPYDEVSEMIACDGTNCVIEWFHFECVGILMAPQGKWYCAECRPLSQKTV